MTTALIIIIALIALYGAFRLGAAAYGAIVTAEQRLTAAEDALYAVGQELVAARDALMLLVGLLDSQ